MAEEIMTIDEAIIEFEEATYGKNVRKGLVDVAKNVKKAIDNQLITVDSTLTESGKGADAKAVGDEFNDLRRVISQIDADVELTPVDVSYELAFVEDIPEGGGLTGGLAFDSGYQDAEGYIHLTKNGVDLPSSSFTPFKVSVGGDAETITAINAI